MAPSKLVVLAPNWLGDAVMALPLFADLRRGWANAYIAVAARPSVAPLFAMVPGIDGIITLDGRSDVSQISGAQFDAALLLPNSFASAWLVRRAGIAERWGYARDLRRSLLTKAVPPPRDYRHQVEYYQGLGVALGLEPGAPLARVDVPQTAVDAATTLLVAQGIASHAPFVVLAPGAAYGRAKQWPPAHFAELARLHAADGIVTVLVGAKRDVAACDEVARAAPAVNLAGRTDLSTLAGIFSLARAVVANDSGAMHLASAVGVAVTAIFGPTDETKTAPLKATLASPMPVIVTTDVWCRPCLLRECPIDHRCMTRLSAAQVYVATGAHDRVDVG